MTDLILRPASEWIPTPLTWLWPGFLADGNVAILDGDPGLGKSLITLDLAARLTTGQPFPDGAASPGPASVLLLCMEDSDAVVQERLRGMGADLSRVFLWPRDQGWPRIPSDCPRLEAALAERDIKLVIIDPIVAFLDRSVQIASDAGVRQALNALARIAAARHCVILLLRHLNKRLGAPALYRGGGSIAFVAACRLAWLAAHDPRAEGRFVLAQQKNNYAPLQPSLAYALPEDSARVSWLGPSTWAATDLGRTRRRPQLQRALAFLKTLLAAGPRTSQDVWGAIKDQGFSKGTLRRAKAELEITCNRIVKDRVPITYWLLPHQELPPELKEFDTSELDRSLRELRRRFPKRTPLDEDED